MKKLLLAGVFAISSVAPAFAGDLLAACEAYAAESGEDASACACIVDQASGNDAVTAELLAVSSEADLETLSEEATAVLAACES